MGTFEQIKNDLTEAMTAKQGTQPYDTVAQVVRVDDNTAWVHIPGGVDETPVAMTVNAKAGDSVRVRVSGGSAWITGSDSAPPTDDRMANIANTRAVVANTKAASAEQLAEEATTVAQTAQQIADNTAQHFWFKEDGTDTGAHIAEVTQEEFEAEPTGANLLAKSDGLYMRDGLTKLAEFKPSEIKIISMDDPSAATYLALSPRGVKWVHDPAFVPSQIIPEETITTPLSIAYINKGVLDGYYTDVIEVEVASIEYKESNRTLFNIGIGSETPSGVSRVVLIGSGLSAGSDNQVIIGKNNKQDTNNKYAFIIGNGRSVALMSNAFAVAWDGEMSIALDVSASTGTTDGDLYAAITTLGWASDVIE